MGGHKEKGSPIRFMTPSLLLPLPAAGRFAFKVTSFHLINYSEIHQCPSPALNTHQSVHLLQASPPPPGPPALTWRDKPQTTKSRPVRAAHETRPTSSEGFLRPVSRLPVGVRITADHISAISGMSTFPIRRSIATPNHTRCARAPAQ